MFIAYFVGQLNQNIMNERDELLIKIASLLDSTESERAFILAKMAFTTKAKEEIEAIGNRLYRKEEGESNNQ